MEWLQNFLINLMTLIGFENPSVSYDSNRNCFVIFINGLKSEELINQLIQALNHLTKALCKKQHLPPVFIDINKYRDQREKLILELARASAKKVAATKTPIELPAMNAYERRLIHLALSSRPEIKTESIGEGKERRIVIKPLG